MIDLIKRETVLRTFGQCEIERDRTDLYLNQLMLLCMISYSN